MIFILYYVIIILYRDINDLIRAGHDITDSSEPVELISVQAEVHNPQDADTGVGLAENRHLDEKKLQAGVDGSDGGVDGGATASAANRELAENEPQAGVDGSDDGKISQDEQAVKSDKSEQVNLESNTKQSDQDENDDHHVDDDDDDYTNDNEEYELGAGVNGVEQADEVNFKDQTKVERYKVDGYKTMRRRSQRVSKMKEAHSVCL